MKVIQGDVVYEQSYTMILYDLVEIVVKKTYYCLIKY